MGIINLTEDSFYEKSRYGNNRHGALERVVQMLNDGADIIDIGACSSRPGAELVTPEKEWEALEPFLCILKKEIPQTKISVDTFRSAIVNRCADVYGEIIVNDISAGEDDTEMLKTVANLGFQYIAMHKRGIPTTMQQNCQYENVAEEVRNYFLTFLKKAEEAGISNIIIDPGFGFSKSLAQNYELLNNLSKIKLQYNSVEVPILVGVSRKSMIYKLLDTTPEDALTGTICLNLIALMNGADILRVHDVKEAKQVVAIFKALH